MTFIMSIVNLPASAEVQKAGTDSDSSDTAHLRSDFADQQNVLHSMQVGEFQCYDRRALASLASSASTAGHPEWGHTGPHDSGEYNSHPEVTIPLILALFCL